MNVSDSQLTFDPYFTVVPQGKWKFQTLNTTLYVPAGTVVIFDKTMFQDRIFSVGARRNWNADHPWIMTEKKGLQQMVNKE